MAVDLVGGCRVSAMREGTPHITGSLSVWNQVGKATGAKAAKSKATTRGADRSPRFENFVIIVNSCGAVEFNDG